MQVSAPAIERLEPFIGEWSIEAAFPGAPPSDIRGRTTFEWALGGQFLLQRSSVPHPSAPDGLMIIGVDAENDAYTQHYFDDRGIARLYAMQFDGRVWTLQRSSFDFSPFSFWQRFTGAFSEDGNRIEGQWESSSDGSDWEVDFGLTYRRVG